MSEYRIFAESKNGYNDLNLLEDIIEAAEKGLRKEIGKLRKLDSWKGEELKKLD